MSSSTSQAFPARKSSDLSINNYTKISQELGTNNPITDDTQLTVQPTTSVSEPIPEEKLVATGHDILGLIHTLLARSAVSHSTHLASLNDLLAQAAVSHPTNLATFNDLIELVTHALSMFEDDNTLEDFTMEDEEEDVDFVDQYTVPTTKIALPLGLIIGTFDIVRTSTPGGSSTIINEINAKAKITLIARPRSDGSYLLSPSATTTTTTPGEIQKYLLHLQYEEVTAVFACEMAGVFPVGLSLLAASHWEDMGVGGVEVVCGGVVDGAGAPLLRFEMCFAGDGSDAHLIRGWAKRRVHGEDCGALLSEAEEEVVEEEEKKLWEEE